MQHRAEFVVNFLTKYLEDADATEMFYKLEYNQFVYNKSFHSSPDEIKLDKLLSHFERVAILHEMKIITETDLQLITYDVLHICWDDHVRNYFKYLDGLVAAQKLPDGNYLRFRKMAKILNPELKILPTEL